MKKILLHICCGPCATATIKKLQEEKYEVVGYYYNPNIHPNFEYKKRLNEAKKLANNNNIELIVEEYQPAEYFKVVKGVEEAQKERCKKCWELRLKKTAEKAKDQGIKTFGSTLRISPYQDQDKLAEVAEKIAQEYSLKFYKENLVQYFQESVDLSKEEGMYRQKYCGCIFSKEHR